MMSLAKPFSLGPILLISFEHKSFLPSYFPFLIGALDKITSPFFFTLIECANNKISRKPNPIVSQENRVSQYNLRAGYYVNPAKEAGFDPASKWLSWPAKILLASHSAPHSPDGLGASRFGWSQSWHRCKHHDCAHTASKELAWAPHSPWLLGYVPWDSP